MEVLFFLKLEVELDKRKLKVFDRILIGFFITLPETRTAEATKRICSVPSFHNSGVLLTNSLVLSYFLSTLLFPTVLKRNKMASFWVVWAPPLLHTSVGQPYGFFNCTLISQKVPNGDKK